MSPRLPYLAGYPEHVQDQVRELLATDRLGAWILGRYPKVHEIQSNAALYAYTMGLKREHLASSPPLAKVQYSDEIAVLHDALGLHTRAQRVHGGKLKSKNEVRVASVFKRGPLEFLHAVVVHELAHLRHWDHDKAFYRLCSHMLADYEQIEFDMRLWLTWRDASGATGGGAS